MPHYPHFQSILTYYFICYNQKMKVIGITGTNGKTTITWILREILQKAGYKVGLIGTLTGRLTTPSPWELAELFAKFKAEKTDYVVMEVSSHGIHQDRIKGIYFLVKLLTNITQDHLDYHKTFREYRRVKMWWMQRGQGIKIYPKDYQREKVDFPHSFIGEFNLHNIQAVLAVTKALGIEKKIIVEAFKQMPPVPGRFQCLNPKGKFKVVVDYAHTPDGLLNVLETSREILKKEKKQGRLITLFGCGGDRDKGKRPKMGRLAYKFSDIVVVTSDNPRSESQTKIIEDILVGIKPKFWTRKKQVIVEADRHKAIEQALAAAKPNDLVLLAGKGHETYQIIGDQRIHFDDREEAAKWLTL